MSAANVDKYFEDRESLMKDFANANGSSYSGGGIKRFDGLDFDTLETLIDLNYVISTERQNESPTAGEFLKFMKYFPNVKAHGYMVSPLRNDVRISIEGLEYNGPVDEDMKKKLNRFMKNAPQMPDEKEITDKGFRIWWD